MRAGGSLSFGKILDLDKIVSFVICSSPTLTSSLSEIFLNYYYVKCNSMDH